MFWGQQRGLVNIKMATTKTIAKMRVGNKHYEVLVDLELALKLRKGESINIQNVLLANDIFYNSKSGEKAASADLATAFGTSDVLAAATRIIQKGDIQLPQDYREEQQDNKKKQVIDFLVKNAADARTSRPFTLQAISNALDQAKVNITNQPIDTQILGITEALKSILPIKIETKKLSITIPAIHTGKVYGIINQYKEKEDWLPNGDMRVVINIPVGLQMEFYDKLNAITHGTAISQEIKQA
jgi:ribosome maturation protein SDO1